MASARRRSRGRAAARTIHGASGLPASVLEQARADVDAQRLGEAEIGDEREAKPDRPRRARSLAPPKPRATQHEQDRRGEREARVPMSDTLARSPATTEAARAQSGAISFSSSGCQPPRSACTEEHDPHPQAPPPSCMGMTVGPTLGVDRRDGDRERLPQHERGERQHAHRDAGFRRWAGAPPRPPPAVPGRHVRRARVPSGCRRCASVSVLEELADSSSPARVIVVQSRFLQCRPMPASAAIFSHQGRPSPCGLASVHAGRREHAAPVERVRRQCPAPSASARRCPAGACRREIASRRSLPALICSANSP